MSAAFWIFLGFVLGGCIGLVLTALLRTATDQTPDTLVPAECRKVRS